MNNKKHPISGIYMIENKTTGQKYIGRSCNIHRRWTEHCSSRSKNAPKDLLILKNMVRLTLH